MGGEFRGTAAVQKSPSITCWDEAHSPPYRNCCFGDEALPACQGMRGRAVSEELQHVQRVSPASERTAHRLSMHLQCSREPAVGDYDQRCFSGESNPAGTVLWTAGISDAEQTMFVGGPVGTSVGDHLATIAPACCEAGTLCYRRIGHGQVCSGRVHHAPQHNVSRSPTLAKTVPVTTASRKAGAYLPTCRDRQRTKATCTVLL